MSDTREDGRDPFEETRAEVFGTFRPSVPQAGRYDDLTVQPMTLEAIERDPMNAIKLDLPADASRELLLAVDDIASHLAEQAGARSAEAHERLVELMPERRGELVSLEQFMNETGPALPVEREPMTLEAIERDPMNAVKLDLPPDASKELLGAVAEKAHEIWEFHENESLAPYPDHMVRGLADLAETAHERRDMALDQLDKLAEREAWQAPEFSRETIGVDPWTAVHLPVPAGADRELLEYARHWAADLERYAERVAGLGALAAPTDGAPELTFTENTAAAAARVAELDHRLELARMPEAEIDRASVPIDTREPRGEFLPGDVTAERGFEHASRVMDLMLQTLIGYFVPEPELTAQQVHDLGRANDERAERSAVELAAREHDAALDAANWTINYNRSPVLGAGDEVRRGESVFDRSPGLTYDGGRDDAGEREIERASYGTGIERGR